MNARSQRLEVLLEAERTAREDTQCGGEHYYVRRHGVWVCVRCGGVA